MQLVNTLHAENRLCKLNDLINELFDYKVINSINTKKLRNIEKGITINDILLYKFMYTELDSTKESIVSSINYFNLINKNNNNTFTRKAFESKENNLDVTFYILFYNKIIELYNNSFKSNNDTVFLAIDGVNNNNNEYDVCLNMGYYDIGNDIPIDLGPFPPIKGGGKGLTSNGNENRNKEIQETVKRIQSHPEQFKNTVIIGDRFYFSYGFMAYLEQSNIKFIIRAKDYSDTLDNKIVRKSDKNYNYIKQLKNKVRIIKCTKSYDKVVFSKKGKKSRGTKYYITVQNNCTLYTNLTDSQMYDDNKLLSLYRQRWSIETFFKFIKGNFKFQSMKEKNNDAYRKLYLCELILTYIVRMLEIVGVQLYGYSLNNGIKLNRSLLVKGVLDYLIYDVIYASLTPDKIKAFLKCYLIKVKNKPDRHFPRFSKKPFSKWYVKCYSASAELITILEAIQNGSVDKLNKNQKLKAKRIKITKRTKF